MPDLWVYPEQLSGTLATSSDALEACKTASFILWGLSGRKYIKTRTVSEMYECACQTGTAPGLRFMAYPALEQGEVYNRQASTGGCGCSVKHPRLRLRGMPVRTVHSVVGASGPLERGSYRVYNSGILELDSGALDTVCGLVVNYTFGTGIPTAGSAAARKLAEELLRGWTGDEECALPSRTTNVSREGISFTVMDKQEFLDDLRTGVYEVDLFLRTVNPDRARRKARVFTPDRPKALRVTSGAAAPLEFTKEPEAPTFDGGNF